MHAAIDKAARMLYWTFFGFNVEFVQASTNSLDRVSQINANWNATGEGTISSHELCKYYRARRKAGAERIPHRVIIRLGRHSPTNLSRLCIHSQDALDRNEAATAMAQPAAIEGGLWTCGALVQHRRSGCGSHDRRLNAAQDANALQRRSALVAVCASVTSSAITLHRPPESRSSRKPSRELRGGNSRRS
jgi:hypothetical protein